MCIGLFSTMVVLNPLVARWSPPITEYASYTAIGFDQIGFA